MKGDAKVIEALNTLIRDELTAIVQYTVHFGMAENWGYQRLHDDMMGRAREEMKHLDRLIGQVLFLEGTPEAELLELHIGKDMPGAQAEDLKAEYTAIRHYNGAIEIAVTARDNETRALLEQILADEKQHADYLEGQQAQIEQVGVQGFLAQQIRA
jgi:bacterioferritin